MRVKVRLFARLKDLAGAAEFEQQVPEPATVRTVWEAVTDTRPALREYEKAMSVAVKVYEVPSWVPVPVPS